MSSYDELRHFYTVFEQNIIYINIIHYINIIDLPSYNVKYLYNIHFYNFIYINFLHFFQWCKLTLSLK